MTLAIDVIGGCLGAALALWADQRYQRRIANLALDNTRLRIERDALKGAIRDVCQMHVGIAWETGLEEPHVTVEPLLSYGRPDQRSH